MSMGGSEVDISEDELDELSAVSAWELGLLIDLAGDEDDDDGDDEIPFRALYER